MDGLGLPEGIRIFRGGCFGDPARRCRAAYRLAGHPVVRVGFLGFRPVAGVKQEQKEGGLCVLRGYRGAGFWDPYDGP